ncbi:MAG: DUF6776 family protein [Steroidobacteraceae bacterium]
MGLFAFMFGRSKGAPRVVQQRAPARRIVLWIAGLSIAAFGVYVVYELGRYNAGYDRQTVAQQRTELRVQIEHLQADNRELRTKLAEFDTIRLGRAREQAEVARSIGDLQAQTARQSEELAFYRGVVAQGAATLGVKIEELRITTSKDPGAFTAHMALVRSGRADTYAAGSVHLSIDGLAGGAEQTLDLAALTGGKLRELRYDFHYFQDFDQELLVPAGFKPEHLVVEVQSSRKDVAPLSQTFLWTVESSP